MPFNINTGVYTPPNGATNATSGQVIQSAVWNTIHADLATAISDIGQLQVATPGPRNILEANGGFEVWQRGAGSSSSITVGSSTSPYTADRWYLSTSANQASTVSAVNGIVNGSRLAAKIQRNSGQSGTTAQQFGYPLDTDDLQQMVGQFVALSLTAKAGANWSPSVGLLQAILTTGTGAIQKVIAGYSNQVFAIVGNCSLATSATKYTFTSASVVPANASQAEVYLQWTPVGTAGTDDSFTVDDVELTVIPTTNGPQLPIQRPAFDVSLGQCRRHFQKTFPYSVAPAQNAGTSTGEVYNIAGKAGANAEFIPWRLPIPMRVGPVVITYNPAAGNANVRDESGSFDCSNVGTTALTESVIITANGNASTAVGNLLSVHMTADAGI